MRRRLGIGENDPLLVTVAALTAEKGHAVLIEALPAIVARHSGLQWCCVGEGPLRTDLERQATALGIGDQVKFLGQRGDVAELLAAADLCVVPSLCEGLCNAAIEALYARLPLVTTTVGGLADVVGLQEPDGPVAWTTAPHDAGQLAAAIDRSLSEPVESQRLADRGVERANCLFTIERMIAETLAMLQQRSDTTSHGHAAR